MTSEEIVRINENKLAEKSSEKVSIYILAAYFEKKVAMKIEIIKSGK
jgi:hypothetical protein